MTKQRDLSISHRLWVGFGAAITPLFAQALIVIPLSLRADELEALLAGAPGR